MVNDENLFLMVLTREFFSTFTDKPIIDPDSALQVETAFSRESREEVDAILEKAIAAGGTPHREVQDYGFMCARLRRPRRQSVQRALDEPVAAEIGPEAFTAHQGPGA
ncbi:VOC family protein [Cryobacterium algoritolerans]|uniref:VOC family protein n=1 Tax=Cryobacterium algoritolerans TaxID=1259184 RepID=UPI001F547A54|nr:hypothetical protein [Cryobacterium algoritolerans]